MTFGGLNTSACKLYVPKGAIESYRKAYGWKYFAQILEISTTAIHPMINGEQQDAIIYTLSGQRVREMNAPGIYIKHGKKI